MNRGRAISGDTEASLERGPEEDTNRALVELLGELVAWTKMAHRQTLVDIWERALSDPRHLLAYELSDGSKVQREVAQASNLTQPTVSNLWRKWKRMGIAHDRKGKVAHLAKPSDFGITIPAVGNAAAGGDPAIDDVRRSGHNTAGMIHPAKDAQPEDTEIQECSSSAPASRPESHRVIHGQQRNPLET